MQEHTNMTLVYVTYGKWHICKSTPPRLQYVQPIASDMYATARRPKLRSNNSLVDPPKGSQNPRFVLGQSYWCTPPWLQYVPLVKSTYARVHHYASSTCHQRWVPCMHVHITCAAHKTCQTQAPHLVILIGLKNLRPILGKPRHSSTGLIKPRASMSRVQG